MLTRIFMLPIQAPCLPRFFCVRNVEIVSNELVLPDSVWIGSVVQIGFPGEWITFVETDHWARHFF
jgi:hypothetical protein